MKYDEVPENIIIKSDITIKQEWIQPDEDDYIQEGDNIDYGFYNPSLHWYESENFEPSEKPLKKKRSIEGKFMIFFSSLQLKCNKVAHI